MQVRELLTRLGFDADTKAAQDYDKTIADIRKTALAAAAAVGALAAGTVALARRMASSGNEVAKSAVEAGLAAGEFQRLTFAIGQVTRLSSQQAQLALLRLNDTIGRARIEGGRYAESLEMLGFTQAEISAGNIDNAEAFARVTEALGETKNAQDAAALASRVLGERVGRQLGPALRLNAEAMVRAREEAERLGGGWSDLALGEAEELTDSFGRVGLITTTLTSTIAETLLPAVRETVDAFVDWFAANRELLLQNIRRWMEGMASAARVVSSIVGALIRGVNNVVQAFGGWERTIRLTLIALSSLAALRIARWVWAVAGALAAAARAGGLMRAAMLALQRIPIIAAFSALVVAIEDLITWIMGGDSAIGQWLGSWEEFRDTVSGATSAVIERVEAVVEHLGGLETALVSVAGAAGVIAGVRLISWLRSGAAAAAAKTVATGALTAAMGGLRFVMMAVQRIPLIALFTGLAYVISDVIRWVRGGDSVLGRWLGTWDDFKVTVNGVTESVLEFLDPLTRQFQAFGEILAGVFYLDAGRILDGFESLGAAVVGWAVNLGSLLQGALNFVGNLLPTDAEILAALAAIGRSMVGWAKDIGARVRDAILGALPDSLRNFLGGVGNVVGSAVSGAANVARAGAERVSGMLRSPENPAATGDIVRVRDVLRVPAETGDETGPAVRMREALSMPPRDPGADVQSLSSSRRIEVSARTEATLQVPQGTTDEQRRAIERQTEEIFSEHWDREMRRALWDFQPVE